MQWLPVLLLLLIAFNQQRLVYTNDLSPWSGGGFGMFSTTDTGTDRHIHIYELSPSFRRELSLPVELEEEAWRAATLPSEGRLRKFSDQLQAALELPAGAAIEIQVWSRRYDPLDLQPDSELLRHFRTENASVHP